MATTSHTEALGTADYRRRSRIRRRDRIQPHPSRRPANRGALLRNALIAIGVMVMVVYFVWLCLEMAPHAAGGVGLLIAIFVAVGLGALAGGLGIYRSR